MSLEDFIGFLENFHIFRIFFRILKIIIETEITKRITNFGKVYYSCAIPLNSSSRDVGGVMWIIITRHRAVIESPVKV